MNKFIEKVQKLTDQLEEAQKKLLHFCQTSEEPLSERFKIWDHHVVKKDHPFVTSAGSIILQTLFDQWCVDYEPNRNETVEWSYIYESLLRDYSENPERYNDLLKKTISDIRQSRIDSVILNTNSFQNGFRVPSSEQEFAEMIQTELINTNFGSFCYTW